MKRGNKPIKHNCEYCNFPARTLTGLANHLKRNHKNVKYEDYILKHFGIDKKKYDADKITCEICDRKVLSLTHHITKSHKDWTKEKYKKVFNVEVFMKKETSKRVRKNWKAPKGKTVKARLTDEQYENWRKSLKGINTLSWFTDKFGEAEGSEKYISRIKAISVFMKNERIYSSNKATYSKKSQELFWNIYNKIKDKYERIYFAELNHEFGCGTHRNFDFVIIDNKKVIEFNGEKFHARYDDKDWHQIYTNKTAEESQKYDKEKNEAAIKKGYSILTIWDSDYKDKPELILNKCLGFLQ